MNNDLTEGLRTSVLAAIKARRPIEIRGSGSKRFLGRTPEGDHLDVSGHADILNYQPKELVVTARCGTSLETIESALAEHAQMLPFEPPHFGPGATIGGTIACGLSGPARPYAGSARDLVLGTRVLTGRGQVLRFGGEVMKNVAGYDLSRLMTGAYGTLGLLLDVSLKVMPIPASEQTLALEQSEPEAIRLMNAWAGKPLPITATCYDEERLYVRLAGAATAVAQAADSIGGESIGHQDALWRVQIREQGHDFFAGEAPLWRLSVPAATPPLELPGRQLIEWGGAQRWYRGELAPDSVRRAASEAGGHASLFRNGDRDDEVLQPLPPALMAIHRSLKQAFDPDGLLNPGRLFAELLTTRTKPGRPDSEHPGRIPSRRPPGANGSEYMQTEIVPEFLETPEGQEADAILRACVHCGFCTATCPTYQLLGDELDGPRGRIYQIKQVLEGQTATRTTQLHLDRCLTCRSCETTCPSGVRYGRLVDIGRGIVEKRVERPLSEKLLRQALINTVPHPSRFGLLVELGKLARPLLPGALKAKVPTARPAGAWPAPTGGRRMLTLAGCVQSVTTPATNAAAARVLSRLGIDLVEAPKAGCCGAAAYHLNAHQQGLDAMRRNIDAWWPEVQDGAEAILINASGCGAMVKEYGEVLHDDPRYADKAARISALARDPVEVLAEEDLELLGQPGQGRKVAFHSPCTQQHAQQLKGVVEPILSELGFVMTPVPDAHLCCGSAGTYSLTQPELSQRLRTDKVRALESGAPEIIATANIGCQLHLEAGTATPVVHWLELLDDS